MAGARGESTIQTESGEIRLLYTNRALVAAEKAMGKSVLAVSQGFVAGESGVTEMVHLLHAGMEAARHEDREGGRRLTVNDALRVMDEVGLGGVAGPVMESIAEVLSYDPTNEDDEEENDPNL